MTAMPTDNRPTGLLGRLFSRPGQSDALGLLGAYLMSAGAPSTDPGASQKMLGQGLQGYHQALREGRLSQMEMDRYRSEQEERQRALEREEAARNMLLGGHMGGQGPAPGSFRASQDMASPGLLASVPEASRPFLRGIAQVDPKLALQEGLDLSQSQAEEYTLAPGAGRYRGDELIAERAPEEEKPFEVQEYEYARGQGYTGSFLEYQMGKRKAGATKVTNNVGPTGIDYGKPPKDMAWARNADGSVALKQDESGFMAPIAVPISGGPVEAEREATVKAAAEQKKQQATQADIVTQDIDRATKLVQEATIPVTGLGSYLQEIPGTGAHDLANLVNTIKANVGFDKLQQMRAASPTGGALGQVSEFENKMLQSVLGALETSQSQEQFLANLSRLRETYLDIIHGPGNRPNQSKYGVMSREQLQAVDPGKLEGAELDEYIEALQRILNAQP